MRRLIAKRTLPAEVGAHARPRPSRRTRRSHKAHARTYPLVLTLALLLIAGSAHATLDAFDFSGPVSEDRFRALIGELRCLVCQNESLVGSQAELAQDLRQEIHTMMAQGKSDQEIIDFMVARYGDFVLYNPPVKPSTYLLWFGPFVLLLIAAVIVLRSVSKRSHMAEATLSGEEQTRVRALLGERTGKDT